MILYNKFREKSNALRSQYLKEKDLKKQTKLLKQMNETNKIASVLLKAYIKSWKQKNILKQF